MQTQTADQVGDGVQIDEFVHLQIIQPTRRGDHYVHTLLHHVDLAASVPSTIDADATR